MAGALAKGVAMISCLFLQGAGGALLIYIHMSAIDSAPGTFNTGRCRSVYAPAIAGKGNGKHHHHQEE